MDSSFFAADHFHPQDCLSTLTMQNIRLLCCPIDNSRSTLQIKRQSSLIYDLNLMTNQSANKNHSPLAPYRLLEKYFEVHCLKNSRRSLLNITSRQAIIDYITREKIRIRAQFLLYLIEDGAFQTFDLWQLCENNDFSIDEMNNILINLNSHSNVFKSLTIGGNNWIYETNLVSGPLKKLLTGSLNVLNNLRLQQLPTEIDLVELFEATPNLKSFEISQPSITGRQLCRISNELNNKQTVSGGLLSVLTNLRSLHLPSSANENGLLSILSHFNHLKRLHCTPFEQFLDILDLNKTEYSLKTEQNLSNLESLSIMHPLSNDACKKLTKICPNLKHLRIEVQEGMNLCDLVENLKYLIKLELINSVSMPLNYTENIQPALNICGSRLESLSLELFDHINMTDLARSCPNLKHLSAQWFNNITMPHIRYYRLLTPKNEYAFQKLQKLRLRPRPHQALPESVIKFLLNHSQHLKHIELYSCSELTDTVIDSVGKQNSLKYLESFIIRHGHSVTNDTLFKLLSTSLATGSLIFHDCGLGPSEISKQTNI